MPLRDAQEVDRWIERERPTATAQRTARTFLDEVGEASWRYPSIPLPDLSSQPEYEMRQAELPVEGEDRPVGIWYRHFYANDNIDVIAITDR